MSYLADPEIHSRAQHAVLTKVLGVRKVYCVLGFSMGGQQVSMAKTLSVVSSDSTACQAYHWATVYPDYVEKIAVVVSAAKTSIHNKWSVVHCPLSERVYQIPQWFSILEGPKAALTASKDFEDGHYLSPPQHGIRAFGRVILGWLHGQAVRQLI
jgi:hypothetical protein